MKSCRPRRTTSLECHADSLLENMSHIDVAEPLFPFYTVPLDTLLEMSDIEPHEELKAKGALVEFTAVMGHAAFISHQWAGHKHPDPELKQLRVLQDALHCIKSELSSIPLDVLSETWVPGAKSLSTKEVTSRPLFFWYDYFCIPQLEPSTLLASGEVDRQRFGSSLALAISSIPNYIARCRFFFALCPTLEDAPQSQVLTPRSWAQRGWCRTERAMRELSQHESWIMIKGKKRLEFVASPVASLGSSPGEGHFTQEEDRPLLGQIFLQVLRTKLVSCLRDRDFVGYRVYLNLQSVYLRGFDVDAVAGLVPQPAEVLPSGPVVAQFLHQNGFRTLTEKDGAGWRPLHYAALSGNVLLIQSLLNQRADPNTKTTRDQPRIGMPPRASAVGICAFFRHNEALQLLIQARAKLDSGLLPALHLAAMSNNADGARLICAAGCRPDLKDFFGFSPLEYACGKGSVAVVQELLSRTALTTELLSRSLFLAMSDEGGTAELAFRLLDCRADANFQWNEPLTTLFGAYLCFKRMQHRAGRISTATTAAVELSGGTPLMAAVLAGQYEGAAALLIAGARADLQNQRSRTAEDLARDGCAPLFLMDALQGQTADCERVIDSALTVAVHF